MSSAYAAMVLASSPKLYYRLGEAMGPTATDSSGNGNNGTYHASGETYGQAGAIVGDTNTAVLLDGAAGMILATASFKTDGWTVFTAECWLKLTNTATLNAFPQLIGNDSPAGSHNGFFWFLAPSSDGDTYYFELGDGTHSDQLNFGLGGFGSLSAGIWYYLAVTFNGSQVVAYVNGASIGSHATSSTGLGTAANPVTISQFSGSTGGNIAGTLDELAIYQAALSPTIIARHYTVGLAANPKLAVGVPRREEARRWHAT